MNVFLGIPTYDGTLHSACHKGVLHASRRHSVMEMCAISSILPHGFNILWCHGVTQGADYFAMLHADIGPAEHWIDTLIDELDAHEADVISAAVPLKGKGGFYSTALGRIGEEVSYRVRHQDLSRLPPTFNGDDLRRVADCEGVLCVNTGCFVCKLAAKWVKDIAFGMRTWITWDGDAPLCRMIPEDWDFSHQCHALGLKVLATTKVRVTHYGIQGWSSGGVYAQDPHLQTVPTPTGA